MTSSRPCLIFTYHSVTHFIILFFRDSDLDLANERSGQTAAMGGWRDGLEGRMRELENIVLTLQAKQPFSSTSGGGPTATLLSSEQGRGQGQDADPGFLFLMEQIEGRLTGAVDAAVAKAVNKVVGDTEQRLRSELRDLAYKALTESGSTGPVGGVVDSGYATNTTMPVAGSKDMSEKELVAELVRRRVEQDKRQRDAVTSLTLANKVRDSLALPYVITTL